MAVGLCMTRLADLHYIYEVCCDGVVPCNAIAMHHQNHDCCGYLQNEVFVTGIGGYRYKRNEPVSVLAYEAKNFEYRQSE